MRRKEDTYQAPGGSEQYHYMSGTAESSAGTDSNAERHKFAGQKCEPTEI